MAMHEFVGRHLDLLDAERQAEIDQTSELLGKLSVQELERRGICLRKLRCASQATGLYGRNVLTFEPSKAQGQDNKLRAHSFGPGDIAGVSYSNSDTATSSLLASGIVSKVTGSSIAVAFEENVEGLARGHDDVFKLTKLANDVTYRRLKRALHELDEYRTGPAVRLIEVLFGESGPSPPNRLPTTPENVQDTEGLKFFNNKLNESQREAVNFALCQREVAVIHGPPGTGKTTTVVEIIQQAVACNMKVLACAPSNVAVDNLLERLAANQSSRIVRLGHPARLLPSIQRFALDAILAGSDGASIVRDIRKELDSSVSQMRKTKDKDERHRLRDEVKFLRRDLKAREGKAIQDILTGADVVMATNTSASDGGPLKGLEKGHFDLVIIDECAQSIEAACWIPLLKAGRCVLAGDHHQLPATIMSKQAATEGLATSLMERIIDLHGNRVVKMLTTQYRMNDQIMAWSSAQLYDGKLVSHETVAGHLLKDLNGVRDDENTGLPLLLIDTAGCGISELELEDEVSKGNEGEADLVTHHVNNLISSGLTPSQIAVIAPYNLQVDLLRLRLSACYPALEIKSVDGFQGREKEAVIISLVRSNDRGEVGFLTEDRRINVAITRAQRHLVVICDSQTVGKHPFLQSLLDYMTANGEVRTAFEYDEVLNSGCDAPRPSHLVFKEKSSSSSAGHHHGNQKSRIASSRSGDQRKGQHHMVKGHGSHDQTQRNKEDATFQEDIKKRLEDLKKLKKGCIEFPASLTSHHRYIIHEVAESLGLYHLSVGEEKNRHIVVARTKHEIPTQDSRGTGKDNIPPPKSVISPIDSNLTIDLDEVLEGIDTENILENLSDEEKDNIDISLQGNEEEQNVEVSSRADTRTKLKSEEKGNKGKESEEKSELEVTKEKVMHAGKGAESSSSSAIDAGLLRCKLCGKPLPPGNVVLHEIHCEKIREEQKRRKSAGAKKKQRSKDEKRKSGLENTKEEDFDRLVEMAVRTDNQCNSIRCREKITITGQQCRYCVRRYCFKHHLPEAHGCEEEARHHIRGQTLRSKVVTNGSGVRERKVDPAHRASLEKKMENRLGKMADKRNRKQKKK